MAPRAIEQDLVELEGRYWEAIKAKDIDAPISLTDIPCIITGAQGVGRIDREAFTRMMTTAPWTLNEFELRDVQVRMLSEDVAIVAYLVNETLTVEGKSVTLKAADSSTWVRRAGRWLCALHTEAVTRDPFGRDRHVQEPSR